MTDGFVAGPNHHKPVLSVQGLKTHFLIKDAVVRAVDGVDFDVGAGEIVGLVGESGSGKTMAALSVLGLIDPPGKVVSGKVLFEGQEITSRRESELRRLRGDRISMIFQDPLTTLSPTMRIGSQMMNVIHAHRRTSRSQAREICRDALGQLGIPSPEERLDAYPHQMSGGMRQRVCIAMAMLNKPALIIADEPTTALDVTTQAQILDEVRKLREVTKTAFIWITHDLAVVSELADRILVMYAGQIVESGLAGQVLKMPSHPYTRGLLDSLPSANTDLRFLPQIAGSAPSLSELSHECRFRPRCRWSTDRCAEMPDLLATPRLGQSVRCFHPVPACGDLQGERS